MKKIILLVFLILFVSFNVKSQFYGGNLNMFVGYESSSVTVGLNTFNNTFKDKIIQTNAFNFGFAFEYLKSEKLSTGIEFNAGIGSKNKNTYKYLLDYSVDFETYEVTESLNSFEFGLLINYSVIGELEGKFAAVVNAELAFNQANFVTFFDEGENFYFDFQDYDNTFEAAWQRTNDLEDEKSKANIMSYCGKFGLDLQYRFSESWYVFGSVNYVIAISVNEGENFPKRNNWVGTDFGLKLNLL